MTQRPLSQDPRVSVAILSWNGREHLATCLEALSRQADPGVPWEICVLDNGSSDGTSDWLRAQHPRIRLIGSDVNLGFCGGYNRLIAETRGEAVALLNNDTRPTMGWLRELVGALSTAPKDVAAVSGVIVDWEGKRLDFGRGVMTFDGHAFQLDFRRELSSATVPKPGEELPFGCGGNMLVRKSAFLAAGGFDEDYFAYLEDVDLGWRLWSGGERIVSAPEAVVHHRSSATSDLLGVYNRGFLFERNAFLTVFKNFESGLWERLMPAILLTFMSRTHTILRENNPGTATLGIDPYAGWIANTAAAGGTRSTDREAVRATPSPSASAAPSRLRRRLGEALRRARLLFGSSRGAADSDPRFPAIQDERSLAQLRATTYLLGHLDQAAAKRRAVAARRRRSDREILGRFPLYVVPTYPGDEALFSSEGFRSLLPPDVPFVYRGLGEIMELGG